MNEQVAGADPAGKRSWRNFAITVAVIAVALLVMIYASPRGFDTDLTKIGNGKLSLVLVFDPNLVVTGEQTHELNQVREEFEPDMQFLLADVGYEQARQFIAQHNVSPGIMLIFSADGSLIKTLQAPLAAQALQRELSAVL